MIDCDFLIIGGGASGMLMSYHLALKFPQCSILLVEQSNQLGGNAYSQAPRHALLNVPHWNMSALPEASEHFSQYVAANNLPLIDGAFALRRHYGSYLNSLWDGTCQKVLTKMCTQVTNMSINASLSYAQLTSTDGSSDKVKIKIAAILALGNNSPASLPLSKSSSRNVIQNPWQPDIAASLAPQKRIYIVGTGLTAVDLVMELYHSGYDGEINLVSRRGNLPLAHNLQCKGTTWEIDHSLSPKEQLQQIRTQIVRAKDWRSVIDGMRSSTNDIWQKWTHRHKRQFIRHLQSYWDIHRHRIACSVHNTLIAMRDSHQLKVHAGRIKNDAIVLRESKQIVATSDESCVVINCTGPARITQSQNLLLQTSLASKLLQLDSCQMGLQNVKDTSFRISSPLTPHTPLYALGTPLKGVLWETTAIPELRLQATALTSEINSVYESSCIIHQ